MTGEEARNLMSEYRLLRDKQMAACERCAKRRQRKGSVGVGNYLVVARRLPAIGYLHKAVGFAADYQRHH